MGREQVLPNQAIYAYIQLEFNIYGFAFNIGSPVNPTAVSLRYAYTLLN